MDFNKLLNALTEVGPWHQHCGDYGEPYHICHFCGEEKEDQFQDGKKNGHDPDCLWLKITLTIRQSRIY